MTEEVAINEQKMTSVQAPTRRRSQDRVTTFRGQRSTWHSHGNTSPTESRRNHRAAACPSGLRRHFVRRFPWPSVAAACDWIDASGSSRTGSFNWLLVLTRSSISSSRALYSSSSSPRRSWRIVAWISSRSVLGALPQAARTSWSLDVPSIRSAASCSSNRDGIADLDRRRVRRASRLCREAPSGRIRRGSARLSPGSWRSTTAAYARCARRAAC